MKELNLILPECRKSNYVTKKSNFYYVTLNSGFIWTCHRNKCHQCLYFAVTFPDLAIAAAEQADDQ